MEAFIITMGASFFCLKKGKPLRIFSTLTQADMVNGVLTLPSPCRKVTIDNKGDSDLTFEFIGLVVRGVNPIVVEAGRSLNEAEFDFSFRAIGVTGPTPDFVLFGGR